MLFLLLVSLLKIKALQQLESANRIVENTSCSSMVILALWGFLSNMSRYDSEDRGRTTMLCRKLKNIFYHFFGQHHSQAALPVFHFFFFKTLLDSFWNLSWYPELILDNQLEIQERSKQMFSTASSFFQRGCATEELQGLSVCVEYKQEHVRRAACTPWTIKKGTKHDI